MRFLADMGVSQSLVHWLRAGGHDAAHLRDASLHRLPNGLIFRKAADEGRIILTFDLDFGEILALSGGAVVSVILFRLNNTRSAFVQARLERVLRESGEALAAGAIVVVDDARHRIRRLPLGS